MGIDLGLKRVSTLMSLLGNPHRNWYSVHVAGTNGKGSVCSYLTSVLKSAQIKSGRFTSPHLINRWDSISIDGESVDKKEFLSVESSVRETNIRHNVGATEFELLTAVAFQIFSKCGIKIAVVEVGLGGRLDATNILEPVRFLHQSPTEDQVKGTTRGVLATIITKIGLDHQAFLGDSLKKIAFEKGGILKESTPCVIDGTNDKEVLDTIEEIAKSKNVLLKQTHVYNSGTSEAPFYYIDSINWGRIETSLTPLLGDYQKNNLACAVSALDILSQWFPQELKNKNTIVEGIKSTYWPGRLQWINTALTIDNGLKKNVRILIDGAHNDSAADELSLFLNDHVRPKMKNGKIAFVTAFTSGKNYKGIISRVIKPGDSVVATEFDSVDGMPWIKAYDSAKTAEMVSQSVDYVSVKSASNPMVALNQIYNDAVEFSKADEPVIVVFGSLYLAGKLISQLDDKH